MSLKNYFDYTKSERLGVFVLVLVVLILLSIRLFFIPRAERAMLSDVSGQEMNHLKQQLYLEEKPTYGKKSYPKKVAKKPQKLKISEAFDPNTLSLDGWMAMGLSEKQASAILNYVDKGGRFYKAEDVRKMYTISDEAYRQMEAFIHIPESKEVKAKVESVLHLSLNAASQDELQQIKGVGPSYSKRIVKYRELLGGYHHPDQLYEVYGFDSTIVASILPYVYLDTNIRVRISINEASVWDVQRHPYADKKMAYAIVHHRETNGLYTSVEQVLELKGLEEEKIRRLLPYLKL